MKFAGRKHADVTNSNFSRIDALDHKIIPFFLFKCTTMWSANTNLLVGWSFLHVKRYLSISLVIVESVHSHVFVYRLYSAYGQIIPKHMLLRYRTTIAYFSFNLNHANFRFFKDVPTHNLPQFSLHQKTYWHRALSGDVLLEIDTFVLKIIVF